LLVYEVCTALLLPICVTVELPLAVTQVVVLHDVGTDPTAMVGGVSRIPVPTGAPRVPWLLTASWTVNAPFAALEGTLNDALPAPTLLGAITPTTVPV